MSAQAKKWDNHHFPQRATHLGDRLMRNSQRLALVGAGSNDSIYVELCVNVVS